MGAAPKPKSPQFVWFVSVHDDPPVSGTRPEHLLVAASFDKAIEGIKDQRMPGPIGVLRWSEPLKSVRLEGNPPTEQEQWTLRVEVVDGDTEETYEIVYVIWPEPVYGAS